MKTVLSCLCVLMLAGCSSVCATRFDSQAKKDAQPKECLKPAQVDLGTVGLIIIN